MNTEPPTTVAGTVRLRITESNETQERVAFSAGIPKTTFSRKINGHVDFTTTELFDIARFLRIPPADLLPATFFGTVAETHKQKADAA